MRRQLLEAEQLADRAAPAAEQDLVQEPVLLGRPALKGRLVARHGREVVPDPPQHVLALLEPDEAVDLLVRSDLGLGLSGVLRHEAW